MQTAHPEESAAWNKCLMAGLYLQSVSGETIHGTDLLYVTDTLSYMQGSFEKSSIWSAFQTWKGRRNDLKKQQCAFSSMLWFKNTRLQWLSQYKWAVDEDIKNCIIFCSMMETLFCSYIRPIRTLLYLPFPLRTPYVQLTLQSPFYASHFLLGNFTPNLYFFDPVL